MIRSLQLRVNKKTKDFDLDREEVENLDAEKKEQVEHIAGKQATVEELTRTMAERLSGENEE